MDDVISWYHRRTQETQDTKAKLPYRVLQRAQQSAARQRILIWPASRGPADRATLRAIVKQVYAQS